MASPTTLFPDASQLFSTNSDFDIVICRTCEHAVHQDHISAHLTSTNHKLPSTIARSIQSSVQQWDHLQDPPDITRWPIYIDLPIPGLTLYEDGLLCLRCEIYISRTSHSLRVHWQQTHGWSPSSHRGRPKPSEITRIQRDIDTNSRPVLCQRIFKQGLTHGGNCNGHHYN
jgi:hypothetical protein